MNDPKPPPTRFVYHATWTVEVPTHPDGPEATMAQLNPIGPGMMGRVIQMTAARILTDLRGSDAHGIRVGAVSVVSEPERISTRPADWFPLALDLAEGSRVLVTRGGPPHGQAFVGLTGTIDRYDPANQPKPWRVVFAQPTLTAAWFALDELEPAG
jgi:hypothetical protein